MDTRGIRGITVTCPHCQGEIGGMCSATGCPNRVPEGKRLYCSNQCANRQQKRNKRLRAQREFEQAWLEQSRQYVAVSFKEAFGHEPAAGCGYGKHQLTPGWVRS